MLSRHPDHDPDDPATPILTPHNDRTFMSCAPEEQCPRILSREFRRRKHVRLPRFYLRPSVLARLTSGRSSPSGATRSHACSSPLRIARYMSVKHATFTTSSPSSAHGVLAPVRFLRPSPPSVAGSVPQPCSPTRKRCSSLPSNVPVSSCHHSHPRTGLPHPHI